MTSEPGKVIQLALSNKRTATFDEGQFEQIRSWCGRVVPPQDRYSWVTSGYYPAPFLVLNREQGTWHGYDGPNDAARGAVHGQKWEGAPIAPDDIPDGEEQNMLAKIESHQTLKVLAALADKGSLAWQIFSEAARQRSRDMGITHNEAKKQALTLLLTLADMQDPAEIETTINDILGFDYKRLTEAREIGKKLNLRAMVLFDIVQTQQAISQANKTEAEALAIELPTVRDDMSARQAYLGRVDVMIKRLEGAKDRPFRPQAICDRRDLVEHRLKVRDDFDHAATPLNRVIVSSDIPGFRRELEIIMWLLASMRKLRGHRRSAVAERVSQRILTLIDKIGDPSRADCLQRNPLWRALGFLCAARSQMLVAHPNWDDIKELIRKAKEAF